jgi:hypothetical protein
MFHQITVTMTFFYVAQFTVTSEKPEECSVEVYTVGG